MADTPWHEKPYGDNASRIGREIELKAWLWLTRRGYEVFDNIFPNGPIDVVAVNSTDGSILKIEVRKGAPSKDGVLRYSGLDARQCALGVAMLIYDPRIDDFVLLPTGEARAKKERTRTLEEEQALLHAARERKRLYSKAYAARAAAPET